MFTLWSDFDRAFFGNPWLGLRRRAREQTTRYESGWGRMNLIDKGDDLVFVAELPGVVEDSIDATVHNDVLNIRAERKIEPAPDMRVHRQERRSFSFQHSISLPIPVDAERTAANIKDGVLRITMSKAPEHKPRQITVQAG